MPEQSRPSPLHLTPPPPPQTAQKPPNRIFGQEADAPGTAFPGAGSEAEAPGDAAEASKVAQLAACTGRSEEDCRAALRQYQEMDAAAEVLLTEEAVIFVSRRGSRFSGFP